MPKALFRVILGIIAVCLTILSQAVGQEPSLSEGEMKQFLLKAKVVNFKQTAKGVTSPWRLTLSDGNLTHDAAFQSIDENKMKKEFGSGNSEFNFRDSYRFNIAAYELAKLLGIGDMLPLCVERYWRGNNGSICWWLPSKMDEGTRQKEKIQPPNMDAWNKQLNKIWVFTELIYNTDLNQTNMLITEDWKLRMIDFSRAFRPSRDLLDASHLVKCDRQLLETLRQLKEADVVEKTKRYIGKDEVKGLMARRDKIVAYFDQQIAQKGESTVLY